MPARGKKVSVEFDEKTSALLLERIALLERRFGKAIDVDEFVTQIVRHKIIARYRDPDTPVRPAEAPILEEARNFRRLEPEMERIAKDPLIDDADPG